MDRIFEGFGAPKTMIRSRGSWTETGQYMPEIDLFERDGKLVVRADLPGMTKDDVHVDITENTIRIEGERKYEHESNEGGVYRSERSYGKFCRDLPIPEGVKTDNAAAIFKDGVLEVTLDAPDMKKNSRRIQIQDQSTAKPGKSAA
jgi:HSP20 family protein